MSGSDRILGPSLHGEIKRKGIDLYLGVRLTPSPVTLDIDHAEISIRTEMAEFLSDRIDDYRRALQNAWLPKDETWLACKYHALGSPGLRLLNAEAPELSQWELRWVDQTSAAMLEQDIRRLSESFANADAAMVDRANQISNLYSGLLGDLGPDLMLDISAETVLNAAGVLVERGVVDRLKPWQLLERVVMSESELSVAEWAKVWGMGNMWPRRIDAIDGSITHWANEICVTFP